MNRFIKAVHAFSMGNIAYILLANATETTMETCDVLVGILLAAAIWSICVCLTYAVLWLDETL